MKKQALIMNYRNTLQQANWIEQLAEQLKKVRAQKVSNEIQSMAAVWRGSGADTLTANMNRWDADVNTTIQELYETADTLRTTARAVYQAELRALEIAQTRNSSSSSGGGGGGAF